MRFFVCSWLSIACRGSCALMLNWCAGRYSLAIFHCLQFTKFTNEGICLKDSNFTLKCKLLCWGFQKYRYIIWSWKKSRSKIISYKKQKKLASKTKEFAEYWTTNNKVMINDLKKRANHWKFSGMLPICWCYGCTTHHSIHIYSQCKIHHFYRKIQILY